MHITFLTNAPISGSFRHVARVIAAIALAWIALLPIDSRAEPVAPVSTTSPVLAKAANGAPADLWSDDFKLGTGCNGPVLGIARMASGSYAVGGEFSSCGNVPARNLAQFDPISGLWSPMRGAADDYGFDGRVTAVIAEGGDLYIATLAGPYKWDGVTWQALAPSPGLAIETLAFHAGALYAGGDIEFQDSSGITARGVARWNGTSWESLAASNGTLEYDVRALASFNGELVAGGLFTNGNDDDVPLLRIARWDGSAWLPLGSDGGNGLRTDDPRIVAAVYGMTTWQGSLYVTGIFTTANAGSVTSEIAAANIARWNGTNWSSVGAGLDGSGRALLAVGPDLYAGGTFANAGGAPASRLAHWNGTAWSAVSPGLAGSAVGTGSASPAVRALALGANGVLVGGAFGTVAPTPAPVASARVVSHIAELVAGELQPLGVATGSGVNGSVSSIVRFQGDLYIGGDFSSVAGVAANNIARWDGAAWHALGEGEGNGTDYAVTALQVAGDDLYVGGAFRNVNVGGVSQRANSIARWDGAGWNVLTVAGVTGVAGSVHALLWQAPNLYVGGSFSVQDSMDSSTSATGVARWDGAAWHAMGPGMELSGLSGAVFALVVYNGELHAGGRFDYATADVPEPVPLASIARWNGSEWVGLGSDGGNGLGYFIPNFASVYALATNGPDLFVGGLFNRVNAGSPTELSTQFLASWDGTHWHAIGTGNDAGPYSAVQDLVVRDEQLFVAGHFTAITIDGAPVPANRVARWDGASWSPLGSGVGLPSDNSSAVTLFLEDNAGVRVGGYFGNAGDGASSNLAHFDAESESIFVSRFESLGKV